ncbi:TolB family protein [Kribbella sp. NPDC056951]|uniref:TolB family protein n=1 Tax=Kribbella sp. NPDC056951 TaxID=3345978 RepID=UPI003642C8AD
MSRIVTGVALIALFVAAGIGYVGWRASAADGPTAAPLDLSRAGTLLYVDRTSTVRQVARDHPDQVIGSGASCHRVYAGAGTLGCLRTTGVPMSAELEVYRNGELAKSLPVWGDPSRVRVSRDGLLLGWTVFRAGDSYMRQGAFSTTAGIFDLSSGTQYGSLEDFTTYVDGKRYSSPDVNFWGVTFLRDSTFYATMASKGRTWLMRGDLSSRRLTSVRENVECPSVSPDQTRIVYKFRTGDQWRLHVLDLASGADHPLAETAHLDDQAAWLDHKTIAYGKNDGAGPAIFTVPADGTGSPYRLLSGSSPAPL